MKRFTTVIVAASLLASPVLADSAKYADRGSLRRVVQIYYAQNNRVQLAVWRDACLHWDQLEENRTARAKLRRKADRIAYDKVANALGDVYSAEPEPTDGNLEQIQKDFCTAADNR
jgi:hypothetical protein